MVRSSASVASILVVVSLTLAVSARSQAQVKAGRAGPPPRAAPAPHFAPRIATPPPRLAPLGRPAPHIAPHPVPHIAVSPRAAPHIAAPPRPVLHIAPRPAPHIAVPPRAAPLAAPRRSVPHIAAPLRPAQNAPLPQVLSSERPTAERLTHHVERQLHALQRQERADQRAQRLQQRLEQQAQRGRLGRSEQRQLQSLQGQQEQRQQRAQMREQMRQRLIQEAGQQAREARQSLRTARQARLTPQAAAENRFAGRFHHDRHNREQWRRARREHWAAREAWRHGIRAVFIPWYGPVYWPYAYSDIFDYTFWPYAYDDSYWAYAYDDFFDGIFFPYGAPYVGDVYSGPYDTYDGTRARVGAQTAPIGSISAAARQLCEEPGRGMTAWPIEQIAETVQPNEQQRALLDDLKNASARAAEVFRNACPTAVPMTPVSRLQAMIRRLQATLDAISVVRVPLEKFYDSLSDEQKARFNAMEANVGQQPRAADEETRGRTTADQQTNTCANATGLVDLPIDRIDEVVQPTGNQEDSLDRLSNAAQKALDTLQAACPNTTPLTPVGRLEAMEQRLNAMLTAAKTIQPALEDFYSSLDNEQKARFNTLDRDLGRGT